MTTKTNGTCERGMHSNGTGTAKLFSILGRSKYRHLTAAMGGRRLWIPKSGRLPECDSCRWRRRYILDKRKAGRPVADIARELGLSVKSVYRIIGPTRGY